MKSPDGEIVSASAEPAGLQLPSIDDLGLDLLRIGRFQRLATLCVPFACLGGYIFFAWLSVWPVAVICLMYLSFVTYGSISHDLVHRNLGLSRPVNDLFLAVIELLALRAGHAYRLAHLHHHARFPHDDDIEGAAASMSFLRTIAEGVIFQPRIMLWAARRPHRARTLAIVEIVLVALWLTFCLLLWPRTPILAVYAVLMIMGSWVIPLITSYIPHCPQGGTALTQTRLFRGKVASIIALEHLYHLEHHLYPMVPHHNWPKLARRLDPFFKSAGVVPVILGF